MPSIGIDRRTAQQLDRRYTFGNQDFDHVVFENFQQIPVVNAIAAAGNNPDFQILPAGATTAFITTATGGRPGGIIMQAALGAGNEARLSAYAASAFATASPPTIGEITIFDATIRVTQITTIQMWAGLKLTSTGVIATDADQALFLFDTTATPNFGPAGVGNLAVSANWYAVMSVGGNDIAFDTGVPVIINKDYRLKIVLRADGVPQFYINNGTPKVIPGATPMTAAAALLALAGETNRNAAGVSTMGIRSIRRQNRVPN